MITDIFEAAKNGIDVRQNLSELRQSIKNADDKKQLVKLAGDNLECMCSFLKSEDAKTRKNAALLMGELELEEFVKPLFEAYCNEEQLFVRSSYLTALKHYDVTRYMNFFKERMETLKELKLTEENKKHISEELKALSELVVAKEGIKKHTFCGFPRAVEYVLITNRLHRNVTEEQISEGEIIPFKGGVRVKSDDIRELNGIRTYSEVLFAIPGYRTSKMTPVEAAKALAESKLLRLIEESHNGTNPYYFRVELKSQLPLDKKSQFTKKLAAELEHLTERKLVNSTSNYEFEIRLIENKEGGLNALLKMYTIKDNRFDYYKEYIPASMKPVNAALMVALARPFMADDAQVLDPFCGVGTMLIERQKVLKANTSYGIDINAEAIEKARVNTEAAGQIIHYINRSFFQFSHEYLFDEIFTDMPFETDNKSANEIYSVYSDFFRKAVQVLKPDGTIIMFSRNPDFAKKHAANNGYKIIQYIPMAEKKDVGLFIIKKQ